MQKHLLLTISDDRTSSYNLRFVHGFFRNKCDVRLTLFYVAPRADHWRYPDEMGSESMMFDEVESLKKAGGNAAVEASRKWIVDHGCSLEFVDTKVVHSRVGTVGEIISEAVEGLYDAVVLGRRGLSWFQELVEDSVSHKILWEKIDFPIWVCRRPEDFETRRNVLLAVDGSTASRRMADHVGFMLADQPQHEVTLFHVRESGKKDDVDAILEKSRAALVENGLAAERVKLKTLATSKPADAILEESSRGEYAVVAVGRTGDHPSALRRVFPGSVSTQLLQSISNACLWVSK